MKGLIGTLLAFALIAGSVSSAAHVQGQLTTSLDVTRVKRGHTYVHVWGRVTITNNESPGPVVPAPASCEIVAKVKNSQETYVDQPPPGRTATRKWKISIPDPDGDSASTAKARIAHCH